MSISIRKKNFELYIKILSWAHLNFELQTLLHKGKEKISEELTKQLTALGYTGKKIQTMSQYEFKKLFEKESFFSSSATGKRIIGFALKENGLSQDRFQTIEDSITSAYTDVKSQYEDDKLLEQSYQHSIDTLCIFKH